MNLAILHPLLENLKNFLYNISMKNINELKQIAKQIYKYEKILQKSKVKNVQEIQSKIENIMITLSIEEMLLLDEIIKEKNFDF